MRATRCHDDARDIQAATARTVTPRVYTRELRYAAFEALLRYIASAKSSGHVSAVSSIA